MITLLAVDHRDPDKRQRLLAALQKEKPDCITVECAPEIQALITQEMGACRARVLEQVHGTDGLHDFIENCAWQEVLAPQSYGASTGTPVHLIDHPDSWNSSDKLSMSKLPLENITSSALDQIRSRVGKAYEYGRSLLEGNSQEGQALLDAARDKKLRTPKGDIRDVHTANELMRLAKESNGNVVHVCGLAHMLDDAEHETLFSLLKDHNVRRVLLSDYEPPVGK